MTIIILITNYFYKVQFDEFTKRSDSIMTKFSFEQKNTCKLIRKFTSKSLTPVNTKVSKETEYEKFLNGILANQNVVI